MAALCLVSACLTATRAHAVQAVPGLVAWRQAHEHAILDEFVTLLGIPNVAERSDDMRRNAELIAAMMRERGLGPQVLTDPQEPDAPPLVYGEWKVPGARRTLVVYAHYDGQPVNPGEWATPPWKPTLRAAPAENGGALLPLHAAGPLDPQARIYARGAGDDKGGVMVVLSAVEALRALHRQPTDNLKIVFEGEEEAGSPHLGALLSAHKGLLASDLWVICDGPAHATGKPLITYGVRGDANVDLTVYGPVRALHSGHYGNWAPNPALRLARLLAAMKDETGRVRVAGWYADITPMGPLERQAIASAAQYDAALKRELGLARTETNQSLAGSTTDPSLNINGMRSADVGEEAANVISTTASAVLDLRLVAGQTPARQYNKLLGFVRDQGYLVLDRAPTMNERLTHALIATMDLRPGAYAAERTPMDEPLAHAVAQAARAAAPGGVVELPTSGGSLPLSIITDTLGAHAVVISIANHDDNQHAANENLRLAELWRGIDLYAALIAHPAFGS